MFGLILKYKKSVLLTVVFFLSISNYSKANYSSIETIRAVDQYLYENKYGSPIFGRIVADYFYLVMKEKGKPINKELMDKLHYDHALETLTVLNSKLIK